MTLIKWRIIVLLEQLKKVTLVAQELGLKQPTVTFHMKSMEEEWGMPLFEIKTGRILLTDAGRRLHRYALKMLALQEEAAREMRLRGGSVKRLSLLADASCSSIMASFAAFALEPAGYGIEWLRIEEETVMHADIHIRERQENAEADWLPLPDADLRLAVSREWAQAAGIQAAQAALESGRPWIAPPAGSRLRSQILSWAAARGLDLEEGHTVPDAGIAASLAAAGLGMAVVPVFSDSRLAEASSSVLPDPSRMLLLPMNGILPYQLELKLGARLPSEARLALSSWLQSPTE
ncbi:MULTISPECIES: LysR family transcriptional regulator [unclassified Paenibacillus]|uniref:LysR family transcriptional regulator n=1 Tax=unclassified Paenibacillus TaxID=185978 RepID=UPI000953BAE1|nr:MULTISPECIES: LysR family transcriptional regulator [unclassified Paenibacillus]ASS64748.2 LysR family transcriptional regulator [Paenibacillus sp. RUD330]SIR08081.1 DNA-binding transcriptional regulator, LysR family [Paenibacillus sp. RU4X]SIR28039.1 DNA-binding transcriptional regulator, LysR family [Paenibacillus sp. RU4T]